MAAKQDEDVAVSVLDKLKELIPSLQDPASRPEQFARSVHKAWKAAGGSVSGKPRHSDRFLTDQLKVFGGEVRSLTPKLVGKTKISAKDADTLLHYFLENWPESDDGEVSEGGSVRYVPLLSKEEIDEISGAVFDYIATGPIEVGAVEAMTSPGAGPVFLPGEAIDTLISRTFEESDAYFIVGTERPLVAQEPKTELLAFRNIINALKDIEDTDEKPRPLVWILDMGRQKFEDKDVESRQRYLGVQALITRFKALERFEDRGRDERWKWLNSRAVVVVLDVRLESADMRGIKRPGFAAHHVSFSAVAPVWAQNANFRALYGSELERLDQRSFSVFYNAKGWPTLTDEGDEAVAYRRYFGYASFARDSKPNADKVGRGLELPPPGASYGEAYRTLYAAAVGLLGLENKSEEAPIDAKHAATQLRYLGFRLLNLSDFMKL